MSGSGWSRLRAGRLRCLINTSILKLNLDLDDPGYGADAVIVDLEDSVHTSKKECARAQLTSMKSLGEFRSDLKFGVRINALNSIEGVRDLEQVYKHAEIYPRSFSFIQLPKVSSADEVARCAEVLCGLDKPPAIMPIIETPRAVANVEKIAAVSDAMMLGCVDLASSMYSPNSDYMAYAKGRFVVACASERIPAIDTAVVHNGMTFDDDAAFASRCAISRNNGFTGKAVIHPSQVGHALRAYSIEKRTIEEHRITVRSYDLAPSGFSIRDGKIIAPPFVAHSRLMLDTYAEEDLE